MMGLPHRLGRYDVLGALAYGGMAEILLARVIGPSGFERPVVIKRILPHLARQESFVSMFLDEARIAASIRHHNVIHVEELAQDADGLYLVMEYLEGESLAGLMRRLFVREEDLDRVLASHIIAEACAGLHAAHEMADADGNKQHLVHRDVSPQNIFVTYDGQVKVLDFGIAKSADRITRTEAGQLKGKFEYMSPEQCNGRPLDRRSDIFALGVVLYEATTARRLFKRENAAETVRAVCAHAVVPPSRLDARYPPLLEAVCLRALEAAPNDRYATMLDMRRDVLAFVREASATADASDALARMMLRVFEDRVAEKKEILRRLRSGSKVTHVPQGEIDEGVELDRIPITLATQVEVSSDVSTPAAAPSASRAWPVYARWGAFVALGVGAAASLSRFSPKHIADTGPRPEEPTPVVASPLPSAVAVPMYAALRVESRPSGAGVFVDGESRGTTPLDTRLTRGDAAVALELRHPGYVTQSQALTPDRDQSLIVDLAPRVASPPAHASGVPATPPKPAASAPNPWAKWH